jgi:hypothetical protein
VRRFPVTLVPSFVMDNLLLSWENGMAVRRVLLYKMRCSSIKAMLPIMFGKRAADTLEKKKLGGLIKACVSQVMEVILKYPPAVITTCEIAASTVSSTVSGAAASTMASGAVATDRVVTGFEGVSAAAVSAHPIRVGDHTSIE